MNHLAGGRIFPGEHHHARFEVRETADEYSIRLTSDDEQVRVEVAGRIAPGLPAGSVFGSLQTASEFFERGSLGYSATSKPGAYEGLELRTQNWHIEALAVSHVYSSFFSDPLRFPNSSLTFDCALLMRGIEHEWHALEPICDACINSA